MIFRRKTRNATFPLIRVVDDDYQREKCVILTNQTCEQWLFNACWCVLNLQDQQSGWTIWLEAKIFRFLCFQNLPFYILKRNTLLVEISVLQMSENVLSDGGGVKPDERHPHSPDEADYLSFSVLNSS